MLWYGSRHYDPELGRFIQPDSIVPTTTQGVQAWDRFAYVSNNPVRNIDPDGHRQIEWTEGGGDGSNANTIISNKSKPKLRFPPNPFSYDTLTIGARGVGKVIIGIDVDIQINLNWKAFREGDLANMDGSLNLDVTVSGGLAVEDAVGLVVYGHDGTVLDQSGFQLIGKDGEIPINAGGCVSNVCGTALYTLDTNDPDNLNGEGFFVGGGADPAAIDLSADVIGGSDWIVYKKGYDDFKFQVPFANREFMKTVPYLGQFFQ